LSFFKSFVEESSSDIFQRFAITDHFEDWNRMFLKMIKKSKEKQESLLLMAILEEEWNKVKQVF
jgi:hypothetical protein